MAENKKTRKAGSQGHQRRREISPGIKAEDDENLVLRQEGGGNTVSR